MCAAVHVCDWTLCDKYSDFQLRLTKCQKVKDPANFADVYYYLIAEIVNYEEMREITKTWRNERYIRTFSNIDYSHLIGQRVKYINNRYDYKLVLV